MATAADVRRKALALDGVSEIDHWGRPAYRTSNRIFAVMRPDGLYLHLTKQRKQFLFEAAPDVFVKFMWSKTANVIVQIAEVSKAELEARYMRRGNTRRSALRRNPRRSRQRGRKESDQSRRHPEVLAVLHGEPRRMSHERPGRSLTPRK